MRTENARCCIPTESESRKRMAPVEAGQIPSPSAPRITLASTSSSSSHLPSQGTPVAATSVTAESLSSSTHRWSLDSVQSRVFFNASARLVHVSIQAPGFEFRVFVIQVAEQLGDRTRPTFHVVGTRRWRDLLERVGATEAK